MLRYNFLVLALVVALTIQVSAQFRASIECTNFVLVSDSTYTGDLKKFIDQTNNNYLPSQVQQGYVLTDANFKLYVIDAINSTTFSSLSVTVTKTEGGKNFPPFGTGQISENLKEDFLAVVPDNQNSVSPVLKSSIESRNYKKQADSLNFLLNNSIDSIQFENDSISVYYHRKEQGRIRIGNGLLVLDTATVGSSSFIDVSFDLPIANIDNELEVIRDGFACSHGRDYTIGLDGSGNRRRITFVIVLMNEFVRIKLRI
jgi:hypothetical protein